MKSSNVPDTDPLGQAVWNDGVLLRLSFDTLGYRHLEGAGSAKLELGEGSDGRRGQDY